jgi:hypothetical protein
MPGYSTPGRPFRRKHSESQKTVAIADPTHEIGAYRMAYDDSTREATMQCSTCRFFQAEQSQCRRYAPQPTADRKNAYWPIVSASDWCGEYEAAERQAATG